MNSKVYKIGAVVIAIFFIGSMLVSPMGGAVTVKVNSANKISTNHVKIIKNDDATNDPYSEDFDEKAWLDEYRRVPEEESSLAVDHNDMGYNIDVGDEIRRAFYLYPGEITDSGPGRTRVGYLNPNSGDDHDYYRFPVAAGQKITSSFSSSASYDFELLDGEESVIPEGYIVTETDWFFAHVSGSSGGENQYNMDIVLVGQDDAGTGNDAGDGIGQAVSITPGLYEGYMDMNDWEDWYSFSANSGQGIFVSVEEFDRKYADFDIHLYNPSGELVQSAMYYGANVLYDQTNYNEDKRLQYPADASGTWKIKIDMFPGWDTSKWPDDYYLYGSGPYEMELSIGGTAEPPLDPIPQPEVRPVSQTFKISNNPNSNDDEYAYLAAVPSAVYKSGGKQYASPIVYNGDNSVTSWYGTAQDTTEYLLDDWNTYLDRHGYVPTVYEVNSDPIVAAAEIATTGWSTSDTVVLAMDGSEATDTVTTAIDEDATLNVKTKKTIASPGDAMFKDFAGLNAIQMWIGKEWGSMTVYAYGSDCPGIGLITPRFETGTFEDWPHPYDTPGDNTNIYFPVALPGLYWPYVDDDSGFDTFEITRYTGDRYKLPVTTTDSSIEVTVTTSSKSYLEVFLIDPQGSVRRPTVPSWNGGPINPIHEWNGDHHNGFEDWRRWEPTYSKEHTVELHYPSEGKWTVIVTPHYPYGQEKETDSISYHINAEVREHNAQRVAAGLSAANGAVLASQMHVPMLYVTDDDVPVETQNAISELGANKIMFVNIDGVSKAKPSGVVTEITTMNEVVSKTQAKSNIVAVATDTDNVITVTSFGSEDGFFAAAGHIAAFHGSNVINIGEVPDAYNFLDKGTTWREYEGGWYHGNRGQGHLAKMDGPINVLQIIKNLLNGEFPAIGLDQHLRWWGTVHDEIYDWTSDLGLQGQGKEAYIFVSPRDTDIRHPICRIMSGLGSYAGQFPMDTPGLDAAHISRDILYSALIYANPGRDVTTAQLMNYPDGWTWKTNDGQTQAVYSTRQIKETFSSHGRFFEGHVIWDNWLDRINEGVSINYYSGHGTGGSGVSAQYKNVAESFPDAELKHEELQDFDWWDSWRGYMYDDATTKSARYGGFTWYNAAEPNLYDIIHFKWVDQLLDNTHSEIELWMSCTTGQHFGPEIYLEHGTALWYGNAGTGLCPQEDLLDDQWIGDMMMQGLSVGDAFSSYVWLHQRDFTAENVDSAKYNSALYGSSSLDITNVQVLFGDPTMTCYSPEWTEPIPVSP